MNKDIGNKYEKELLDILSECGWWCHLFAYKPEGQPCDIVALRNNIPMLIDVKHCSESRFNFSNIGPNQRNCFDLAMKKGNKYCGFAIYFEKIKEWRFIMYDDIKKCEIDGWKSVSPDDCWVAKWN